MGKSKRRWVARAVAGEGWRIWDNKLKRFWGQTYDAVPEALLDELNGQKRPDRLTDLQRRTARANNLQR
jgi:hypothetical protein